MSAFPSISTRFGPFSIDLTTTFGIRSPLRVPRHPGGYHIGADAARYRRQRIDWRIVAGTGLALLLGEHRPQQLRPSSLHARTPAPLVRSRNSLDNELLLSLP